MINQITVFLENKEGRLAALVRSLADAGINMQALTIADTTDYGVARIICDDPTGAVMALNEQGYRATLTKVSAIAVPNVPGGLAKLLNVLDDNDVIVSGHARLKAAMMLGMEEVPCTYASGLTEDEIRAFRIADNKTAEIAGWNYDKLVEEMTSLAETGFEMDFTGFNEAEQLYYSETDATPDRQDRDEFREYEEEAEADVIQSFNVAIVCESREDKEYLANLIHETKRLKRLYLGAEIAMLARIATA